MCVCLCVAVHTCIDVYDVVTVHCPYTDIHKTSATSFRM